MVFGVWFCDNVIHVDDPVGAVAVHFMNGVWGTIAVGLFSTNTVPGYSIANANGTELVGLFYGGGFKLLGIQIIGLLATAGWTAVTITIAFLVIKKVIGLRVSEEEEIKGLDSTEHGLPSAYSGFAIMDVSNTLNVDANENTDLGVDAYEEASPAMRDAAVKVVREPALSKEFDSGMHKVTIVCKLAKFDVLKKALNELGITGMTMSQVMGCGIQKGSSDRYRGAVIDSTLLPKVKVEVVVSKVPVSMTSSRPQRKRSTPATSETERSLSTT